MKFENIKFTLGITAAVMSMNMQPVLGNTEISLPQAISRLQKNTIRKFKMVNGFIGIETATDLRVALLRNTSLKELTLRGMHIKDKHAIEILKAIKNNKFLTVLDLSSNFISDEPLFVLPEIRCHLQIFDLSNNIISAEGAIKISEAVKNYPDLRIFNVSGNAIGDEGAIKISEAVKNCPNLKIFNVSRNSIRDEGLTKALQVAQDLLELEELNLGFNSVENPVSMQENVAAFIEANTPLKKLILNNNDIDDGIVKSMCEALAKNTHIEILFLNGNVITFEGLKFICDIFGKNSSLKIVSLCFNFIKEEDLEELCNHDWVRRSLAQEFSEDQELNPDLQDLRGIVINCGCSSKGPNYYIYIWYPSVAPPVKLKPRSSVAPVFPCATPEDMSWLDLSGCNSASLVF